MPDKGYPEIFDEMEEEKEHVLHFAGPINPVTVHNIKSLMLQALNDHASHIKLIMSSEGGDLNSGLSLYHFLRALPVPLSIYNFGSIESIALLIYLAADTRFVVEHGRFLIHCFHANLPSQVVDHGRLAERARSIGAYAETYAKIFDERTKGAQTPINVRQVLNGEALIVDSATATTSGIATGVNAAEGTISATDVHWWAAP